MELKPGSRWKSAVCSAEVIVVRATKDAAVLACGGHPMTTAGAAPAPGGTLSPDFSGGVQVGKRYVDADSGVEMLCTKAGPGSLSLNGRPLTLKQAKALPASD
jgi:hypothetical protein